ncbi:MAG: hypothetical protein AAFQ80_01610 [Cyanobacteria bacterium J06621_8]
MNSQGISFSILIVGIFISTLCFNKSAGICLAENNSQNKAVEPPNRNEREFAQYITHQIIGSGIITKFTPRDQDAQSIDLNLLAASLGYDHFNWASYVEQDPYGIVNHQGEKLKTPYNDPPQGGYRYDAADMLPFYWDVVQCDRCKSRHHFQHAYNSSQFQLIFEDFPADYRLQSGEAIEFVTSLVGVKFFDPQQHQSEWEILYTFRWQLTNPRPHLSQVSLIDHNLAIAQLSPVLLQRMKLDGAIIIEH